MAFILKTSFCGRAMCDTVLVSDDGVLIIHVHHHSCHAVLCCAVQTVVTALLWIHLTGTTVVEQQRGGCSRSCRWTSWTDPPCCGYRCQGKFLRNVQRWRNVHTVQLNDRTCATMCRLLIIRDPPVLAANPHSSCVHITHAIRYRYACTDTSLKNPSCLRHPPGMLGLHQHMRRMGTSHMRCASSPKPSSRALRHAE